MSNLLKLLPNSVFKDLENEAVISVVLSLQRLNKTVTGATAETVNAKTSFESTTSVANIPVFGAGGLPFIISGKPANTKMPVRKVGNTFELFPDLKNWKAVTGFGGSDFVLARSIAENPQAPVDIASEAEKIFLKRTEGILPVALARLVGTEIKEKFDEDKKI